MLTETTLFLAQQAGDIFSTLDLTELATKAMAMFGSAAAAWWVYKTTIRKTKLTQQEQFYQSLLGEYYKLRDMTAVLQKEIGQLQNEIKILHDQLEFFEENSLAADCRKMIQHVMNFNDRSCWIHCVGSSKWYLNDKFCQEFKVDRKNFWTPVNVFARFNPEDVLKYAKNDLEVIEANSTLTFEEEFCQDIMNPDCPEKIRGKIKKSAFQANGNIYIVGEILEIEKV